MKIAYKERMALGFVLALGSTHPYTSRSPTSLYALIMLDHLCQNADPLHI